MAQQTLRSVITIGGNVDGSFGRIAQSLDTVGNTLINIGSYVDKASQKLIAFGKESVTDYADFDDIMRKIQSVSEMTDSELAYVEKAAREMGKTTRYTASDAAEASLILAQVGLDYREIIDLLPEVLQLAQAGDMSIADASDYLYSSLKSMGYGLEYADTLIDQMAKTASIGATDVDTLGESLTRIGSGLSMFKGGSTEVLTILSAMSEYGEDMRGTQGGTALRNFMLSLAAPAGNGDAVIAMLENVGSSMEELDEIMEDVDLFSASKAIKDLGLSVYDENGNLRGGIELITGLRDSVAGLNDQAQYNALAKIFGKRTITTAMNLIKLTDEEWNQLQKDIADSDGYAEYMASIQEGGLGGSLRLLKSQWEEFKLTIGENLAPNVESAAAAVGDALNSLSNMDEGTLNALVSGLTVIAAAGPGLLAVGGAFKLLAFACTPAGFIGLTAVGVAALAVAMKEVRDADMSANFGTLQLDMNTLGGYADSLTTDFAEAVIGLGEYSAGVDAAVQSYQSASEALSGDLLTSLLTQTALSEEDKTKLQNIGKSMLDSTLEGITTKQGGSNLFLEALFGGDYSNESLQNLVDVENSYYAGLMADAYSVGEELRSKMTEALRDGSLNTEEYESVMQTVKRMNEINAQVADIQNRVEYEKLFHKAQTASFDDAKEYAGMLDEARDQKLAAIDDAYETERAWAAISYDEKIAKGEATEAEKSDALAAFDKAQEQHRTEINAQYTEPFLRMWDSVIGQSDLNGAYAVLSDYADQFLSGKMNTDEALAGLGHKLGASNLMGGGSIFTPGGLYTIFGDQTRQQLGEYLIRMSESFGGMEGVQQSIDYYNRIGEELPDTVKQMARIATMEQLINNFGNYEIKSDTLFGLFDGPISASTQSRQANKSDFLSFIAPFVQQSASTTDTRTPLPTFAPPAPTPAPIAASDAEADAIQYNQDFSARATPTATVSQSPTAQEDAAQYSQDFSSSAAPQARVSTNDAAMAGILWQANFEANCNPEVRVRTRGGAGGGGGTQTLTEYADGGRADEPSIFGEAGAEWAIPEEHSNRTAELLNAAAQASGFTWPEIIGRFGGLNANPQNQPMQLVYAPVIHAQDARGVEEKLIEDKRRFDEWWERKKLLEGRVRYQ